MIEDHRQSCSPVNPQIKQVYSWEKADGSPESLLPDFFPVIHSREREREKNKKFTLHVSFQGRNDTLHGTVLLTLLSNWDGIYMASTIKTLFQKNIEKNQERKTTRHTNKKARGARCKPSAEITTRAPPSPSPRRRSRRRG